MPISLSLKPAIVEFQIKPGSSFTQAYQVTNLGSHPEILTASILPFSDSPSSTPRYTPPPVYPGFIFNLANADIKLDTPFRLEPGQSRQLVLKVAATTSTPPSDGYFTLFLTSESYQSSAGFSPISARIGSHLLLSAQTDVITASPPRLSSFKFSPSLIDILFTPIRFSGNFTNHSLHFTKIQGKIELIKSGNVIRTLTLAPDNVLTNSSRPFRCLDIENNPIPCQLNPPFWPGLYQVKTPDTTQSFYVWPLSPIILMLIIITTYVVITKLLAIIRSGH